MQKEVEREVQERDGSVVAHTRHCRQARKPRGDEVYIDLLERKEKSDFSFHEKYFEMIVQKVKAMSIRNNLRTCTWNNNCFVT